jgi:hypothetical protein
LCAEEFGIRFLLASNRFQVSGKKLIGIGLKLGCRDAGRLKSRAALCGCQKPAARK